MSRAKHLKERADVFNLKEMIRVDTDVLTNELDESGVTHFMFAQSKYVGFRCKYEYDFKYLLIATEKSFCIVNYKLNASYEQVKKYSSPRQMQHKRTKSEDVFQFKSRNSSDHEDEDGVLKEKAKVMLRWRATENETIKHISFVDDERPLFLFLVL